jgi:hypothetical protein
MGLKKQVPVKQNWRVLLSFALAVSMPGMCFCKKILFNLQVLFFVHGCLKVATGNHFMALLFFISFFSF